MVQDLIQPTESSFSQIGLSVCPAKLNGKVKMAAMLDLAAEPKMRKLS